MSGDRRDEDLSVTYRAASDFVEHINEAKDPIHRRSSTSSARTRVGDVEVALQWNSGFQDSVFTFASNINTHGQDAPLASSAISRTISNACCGRRA